MEILKKVLKEEMSAVLASLKENNYYQNEYQGAITTGRDPDKIIYDNNLALKFAATRLQNDLINLKTYDIADYLALSEFEEKWNFICPAAHGMKLLVEIVKKVEENGTFWSMIFSKEYINTVQLEISDELNNVKGYTNFVKSANMSMKDKIDPNKIR
jgi:hypothetical protein